MGLSVLTSQLLQQHSPQKFAVTRKGHKRPGSRLGTRAHDDPDHHGNPRENHADRRVRHQQIPPRTTAVAAKRPHPETPRNPFSPLRRRPVPFHGPSHYRVASSRGQKAPHPSNPSHRLWPLRRRRRESFTTTIRITTMRNSTIRNSPWTWTTMPDFWRTWAKMAMVSRIFIAGFPRRTCRTFSGMKINWARRRFWVICRSWRRWPAPGRPRCIVRWGFSSWCAPVDRAFSRPPSRPRRSRWWWRPRRGRSGVKWRTRGARCREWRASWWWGRRRTARMDAIILRYWSGQSVDCLFDCCSK